eukprot:scaffold76200_cov63-Phaeocystis_antarctica.AAC.6
MPSQSAVTAEIYRSHLGKGKWINTMGDALVPHGEGGGAASSLSPAALFNGGLPLSPQEAARLERQAAASGGMAGAVIVGSLVRYLLTSTFHYSLTQAHSVPTPTHTD